MQAYRKSVASRLQVLTVVVVLLLLLLVVLVVVVAVAFAVVVVVVVVVEMTCSTAAFHGLMSRTSCSMLALYIATQHVT